MNDKPASDKQVRFAIDLLKDRGISQDEVVNPWIQRRYKQLPQGDTVRNAVKSLTMAEASELIKGMVGADN
jgi:hypothetical protein